MNIFHPLFGNNSNQINIFQNMNILKDFNCDIRNQKNIINNIKKNDNNEKINTYENKNYNKIIFFPNNNNKLENNFLNIKRKRISENEENNYSQNNIIKIDLSEDNNDQNCINNDEIFNDKIKNILSNILEYDSNFENYIKSYSKKYFWKNIIFLKLGGQDKLLHEIIKGIHNYNININKKHKLPVNSYIKDNDLIFENNKLPINENKENKNKFDDDEIKINEEKNNQIRINNITEEEKLLIQIENTKGLENEIKFLKEFLYNENYFKENQIFFPENFVDNNISNEIADKNNLLREVNSLKLYGILKLLFPSLENEIFKKNIRYLEYLANYIDKFLGGKYLLLINMIYFRIKKEVTKTKKKLR